LGAIFIGATEFVEVIRNQNAGLHVLGKVIEGKIKE
jgi:hypothetical protein